MRVFLPNDMTGSFYLSRLSRDAVWPCIDEDQICGRSYTSGTTGDTKGVCYSNRSTVLHAYAAALPDSFGLPARDCVMPVVPMFHVNAWGGAPYAAPMVGAKLVLPKTSFATARDADAVCADRYTDHRSVPTAGRLVLSGFGRRLERVVLDGLVGLLNLGIDAAGEQELGLCAQLACLCRGDFREHTE